jgi:3-oxoacyl-[acyl-carrier protein] reductase
MSLDGNLALVTGSGRGIGRAVAVALALARCGCDVVVHGRNDRAAAEEVAAAIRAIGRQAWIVLADLGDANAVDGLFSPIAALSRPLDVLVNNAGIWRPTPLGSTTVAEIDAMLATNLRSVFLVTQAALAHLKDGARIINVSSTAARSGGGIGRSLYAATKAAVDAFTRSWSLELAPRGIAVNAVAPGYVETDMTQQHLSDPAIRRRALDRQPLGDFTSVEQVAATVAHLAAPGAHGITGQSINISGGFVL